MIDPPFEHIAGAAIGAGFGLVISTLYFSGLATGIRMARAARFPALVLLVSALVRIVVLMSAGLWIAQMGAGALLGFSAAFILARITAVRIAQRGGVHATYSG